MRWGLITKYANSSGPRTLEISAIVFLTILKMYWIRGITLFAYPEASHDEGLFLRQAAALIQGNWLGDYNQFTLIKGPFYPLWIALAHFLHIPLLNSHHMLYGSACVVVVVALSPLIRVPWMRVLVFTALWFNPVILGITSTLRDAIYPSLTMLVFACSAAITTRAKRNPPPKVWLIGLGFSFAALWLTREEGIWILPLLPVLGTWVVFQSRGKLASCMLMFIPTIVVFVCLTLVKSINYYYYKSWVVVEVNDRSFLDAYQALARVKPVNWHPEIPVPREVREKIYLISETFSKLRPFLEGSLGKNWSNMGPNFDFIQNLYEKQMSATARRQLFVELSIPYAAPDNWTAALKILQEKAHESPISRWKFYGILGSPTFVEEFLMEREAPKDMRGGWFIWALRDSAALAGSYQDGATSSAYFSQVAREVGLGCENGKLSCNGPSLGLIPPLRADYLIPWVKVLARSAWFVGSLKGPFLTLPASRNMDELTAYVTTEHLRPPRIMVSGWLSHHNADLKISVEHPTSLLPNTEVKNRLPSEDVYQFFLIAGAKNPALQNVRFSILTNCIEGCDLVVRSSDGTWQRRWPFDALPRNVDEADIRGVIDSVRMESSPYSIAFEEAKSRWRHLLLIERIDRFYVAIFPWLVVVGILFLLVGIWVRRKNPNARVLSLLAGAAWLAIFSRLAVFSLISVTSFPAISWGYLGCLVPLALIASLLPFFVFNTETSTATLA